MTKNIILLTIDCLRADHCSWLGYERETTPTLDRLASDSHYTVFTNAYSASSHTPEALPAILTGCHPDIFSNNNYRLAADTIASKLKQTKYRTGGFHSNANVSRVYGYGDEFDRFDDDLYIGTNRFFAQVQKFIKKHIHQRPLYYARADTINQRCLEWEASLEDEPMFLWAHYMDVHGPYDPVNDYRDFYRSDPPSSEKAKSLFQRAMDEPESITETEQQTLIDFYDAEIRYVDSQIDSLLTELEERGRLKNALIIITADHGDGFGEHGYYNHPRHLHDELTHVPLLAGEINNSGTIETPVSTLDIVPTILEAAQLDSSYLPGEPLQYIRDDNNDRVVYSQTRGQDEEVNRRRFRITDDNGLAVLEKNLETEETTELCETDPSLMEQLKSFVKHRQKASEPSSDPTHESQSDEIDKRLEALGYK